ncbi:hypothetical protein AX16_003601 [Volvariella volvacea WC 439]|nr:hypothetical protein AX16_003601 [Volvariella volvacea WC 439]
MATKWEPSAFKAQLRLTSQRLGQLQERMDSKSTITRKDIATLLQEDNVALARVKAGNLIQEDVMSDLLEVLEMHTGVILEHLSEIDQNVAPSPVMVEAISSVIYAAPMTDSKDLNLVRDILIQRLGPDFAHAAIGNRDSHVSSKVVKALAAPPPSAAKLDTYLQDIATSYGVHWKPEPQRQDILNTLSEILAPEASPVVDLPRLRKLCSQGIPDEPKWLRPRIWKLFLGLLPAVKASWKSEIGKQRESYYDLIRRLLPPLGLLPPPNEPPHSQDKLLLDVSAQLARIPPSLFDGLEAALEITIPGPLHESAPSEIKISCAGSLDVRLETLRTSRQSDSKATPAIRLEMDESTPGISLSSPTSDSSPTLHKPKTLLPSRAYHLGNAHPQHLSALLRLLYLHASINPGNLSPHIPSLLIPLYTVVIQEVEPESLAHTEADAFWLFETVVGEFSELEDEEGGSIWVKRLSQRLQWADNDLWDSLNIRGLDPALPHYSYRWLAPLLSHTIPLSSAILVWDVLFAQKPRERDQNHKLEYLIDVCTAMLLRAKVPLQRLGKGGRKSPSLWADEAESLPPPSPLRSWEMGDAFLEGTTLLQLYPLEATGGIERILQTANDLAHRREEEAKNAPAQKMTLGERLRVSMWKGFTNQVASPTGSPEESESSSEEDDWKDDGDDTETPATAASTSNGPGIGSRLATTVWRGITNQSSMDAPPSPMYPSSPVAPAAPPPSIAPRAAEDVTPPSSGQASSFWSYAEKLRDSDTAAQLAKVSTNWRARALLGAWGAKARDTSESLPVEDPTVQGHKGTLSDSYNVSTPPRQTERRTSLPGFRYPDGYTPPPRPAYFRPPRDSWLPAEPPSLSASPVLQHGLESPEGQGLISKAKNLSWSSLTGSTAQPEANHPSPKSAPRPLLLGSTPVVGLSRTDSISRSANSTPTLDNHQWAEIMDAKRKALHRGSQSSISSLSPSDALNRLRYDVESDTTSRKVPLNRRSISPMAPPSRILGQRLSGYSSPASSDHGSTAGPQRQNSRSQMGWGQVNLPDSPPAASSGPNTPHISSPNSGPIRITDAEPHRGSVVLNDLEPIPLEPLPPKPRLTRKKTPPTAQFREPDSEDSSAIEVQGLRRVRSKKYPPRLANLHIQDMPRSMKTIVEQKSSPNSLAVEWPHEDLDSLSTPRASQFDGNDTAKAVSPKSPRRIRKTSMESRKVSGGSRVRKVSSTKVRESSADEGDDEGYDDLLSAYESEDAPTSFLR